MWTRNKAKAFKEHGYLVEVSSSETGQGTHTRWFYPPDSASNIEVTRTTGDALQPTPSTASQSLKFQPTAISSSTSTLCIPSEPSPDHEPAIQDAITSQPTLLGSEAAITSESSGWQRRVLSQESPENFETKMEKMLEAIRDRELEVLLRNHALYGRIDPRFEIDSGTDSDSLYASSESDDHDSPAGVSNHVPSDIDYIRVRTEEAEDTDPSPPTLTSTAGRSLKRARSLSRTDTEIDDLSTDFRGPSTPADNGNQIYRPQGYQVKGM